MSFATTGFERVTKGTRKRKFFNEMNLVISWSGWLSLTAPRALPGKTSWPPFATQVMLPINLIQQFFAHSEHAM
jgi:IS5 family transposase